MEATRIPDIHSRNGGAEVGAENRKIFLSRVVNITDTIIAKTYKHLPTPQSVKLNYDIGGGEALRIQREVDDPRSRKFFDRHYIITYKPVNTLQYELNIYTTKEGLTSRQYKTEDPGSEHHYYKVEIPQNIATICEYLNLIQLVLNNPSHGNR